MSRAEKTKQLTQAIEEMDARFAVKLILQDTIKSTDLTDEQYSRFLKSAVNSRDTPLLRKLLETRPKLDGTRGAQLLWEVILDDDTQIAEMLVRAGADVNQSFTKHSSSLLQVLARNSEHKKIELALLMIEHGADVRAENTQGKTAFAIAMKHENFSFVQELLNQGVKIDDYLLAIAIVSSPKPVESMLMLVNGDHIRDATTRSKLVTNAFSVLCRLKGDNEYILDMAKALLDLEIPPLYEILDAVRFEQFNVVKLLLERTDIDRSTKMIFLLEAIQWTEITMARLLIEWGADIEYNDPEKLYSDLGMRALHYACLRRSPKHIQLLLHLGANVNALDIHGKTPFSYLPLNFGSFTPGSFLDNQVAESLRLVIKRMALSLSEGVAVNENDLDRIRSYPILQQIYEECSAELQAMKGIEIVDGFPFYSIFTGCIQNLSLLVRRQTFMKCYNKHLNSFSEYRSQLNVRIREAESRKKLLMPKEDALHEALREILPDIPMEKIIRYLYLSELESVRDRIMMLDSESKDSCM